MTRRAVVARELLALDDARRIRAGSDGAGTAMLRVAVCARAAADPPTLHHALEPATLRRAGDLHDLAGLEDVHLDGVADLVLDGVGLLRALPALHAALRRREAR